MKPRVLVALIAVLLALFAVFLAARIHEGEVLRLRDRATISFEQMVLELKSARIVVVGEVHDEQTHHALELIIIRALVRDRKPTAIALEMFRADSQNALDEWVDGTESLGDFQKVYYDNWREPWPLYAGILRNARDEHLPLIGLNLPDVLSERVAARGFAALSAADKAQLPPRISCTVDPTYKAFIRHAYSDHAGHSGREFTNFCEAQMVWDKTMAWRLQEYVRRHPATRVIVLAGVGHAWKRGIVAHLSRPVSRQYKVVLPLIPGMSDPDRVTSNDADYVVLR